MTINASKVPFTGSGFRQPALEAGGYPGRLVQVIDLGLQPQEYQGEEKAPKYEIMTTYELADEFCITEEGEVQEDRPRWISESFTLNPLNSERAKSTQRYLVLDPNQEHEGDWGELLGTPVLINVVQNLGKGKNVGKIFNKISGIAALRAKDAAKVADLVRQPAVFTQDDPDLEVFESLPQFIQDKIKSNLEFEGSNLQKLLSASKAEGKPDAKPEVEKDKVW